MTDTSERNVRAIVFDDEKHIWAETRDGHWGLLQVDGTVRFPWTNYASLARDYNLSDRYVPAAQVAALEKQVADLTAELTQLRGSRDAIERLEATVQHVLETVLRLKSREDLSAFMGYELGLGDAGAEAQADAEPRADEQARADEEASCPHCSPTHGDPNRRSWGVYVAASRDGDNQPVRLHVQPSNGAHVAASDAAWLRQVIRDHQDRANGVTAEERPEAEAPVDLIAELAGIAQTSRALADRATRALAQSTVDMREILAGTKDRQADRDTRGIWLLALAMHEAHAEQLRTALSTVPTTVVLGPSRRTRDEEPAGPNDDEWATVQRDLIAAAADWHERPRDHDVRHVLHQSVDAYLRVEARARRAAQGDHVCRPFAVRCVSAE